MVVVMVMMQVPWESQGGEDVNRKWGEKKAGRKEEGKKGRGGDEEDIIKRKHERALNQPRKRKAATAAAAAVVRRGSRVTGRAPRNPGRPITAPRQELQGEDECLEGGEREIRKECRKKG